MSIDGAAAYDHEHDLPPLVQHAVALAKSLGFDHSCLPAQGRLLALLAAGRPGGLIGEVGTGCGVGLAWMAGAARSGARLVSVERDPGRAAAVRALFADHPNVTLVEGDWRRIEAHAPFDLLVLDGAGSGKAAHDHPEFADHTALLRSGGTLVIDDFTPTDDWPPTVDGRVDEARVHWLTQPELLATEVRLGADLATVVATRRADRPAAGGAADVRRAFVDAIGVAQRLIVRPEVAAIWEQPSALGDYSVGNLCGHLARTVRATIGYVEAPEPEGDPIDVAAYYAPLPTDLGSPVQVGIRQRGAEMAADGPAALADAMTADRVAITALLGAAPANRLVTAIGGAVMRLDDYVVTRIIEVVVHSDDVAASVGVERPAFPAPVDRIAIDALVGLARARHGDANVLRALTRRERDPLAALRIF